MLTEAATFPVCFWAPVLCTVLGSLISIFVHASAQLTDRDTVIVNGEIVFIREMPGVSRVQVDKGCGVLPCAVFIDSVGIMGGIQKELLNAQFRKIRFHGEKGMEKGKHVMPGSLIKSGLKIPRSY